MQPTKKKQERGFGTAKRAFKSDPLLHPRSPIKKKVTASKMTAIDDHTSRTFASSSSTSDDLAFGRPSSPSSSSYGSTPAPPPLSLHYRHPDKPSAQLPSAAPCTTTPKIPISEVSRFSLALTPPLKIHHSYCDSDDDEDSDGDDEDLASTASSAFMPLALPLAASPTLRLPLPLPPLCYKPAVSCPSSASPNSQPRRLDGFGCFQFHVFV